MGRADNGVSAPFGYSKGYRNGTYKHHGIDSYWLTARTAGSQAASDASKRVFSVGKGVVVAVWNSSVMGGCIRVRMGAVDVEYCHMPFSSWKVSVGQSVTDQTYLGPMGNSGTAAFGQLHLHMQVRPAGANPALENRIDPEPYFTTGGTIPMNANQRQVKANAFSNKRSAPIVVNDPTNITGVGKADSIITLTGWLHGQKQADGNDIWFTDDTGWYWSGGFTDASATGIPDVNPKPVPDPIPAPVDVAAIVAGVAIAIKSDLAKLSTEIAAIKVPTAAQVAKAVNDDAAARLAQ